MSNVEPPRRRALREALRLAARALRELEEARREAARLAEEEVKKALLESLYAVRKPVEPSIEELRRALEEALGQPLEEALKAVKQRAEEGSSRGGRAATLNRAKGTDAPSTGDAAVAQLAERRPGKAEVPGSNPGGGSTTRFPRPSSQQRTNQ